MQYSVIFRPGIHCLKTHLIKGLKNTKGLNILTTSIYDTHSKNITRYILGQKRNAAYKEYYVLNESYNISYAIYVSLLFLPHIIYIFFLGSVNPNQCTGCLFIFRVFTCTFILFRFTHVVTTEITSLISNLLESILKI